MSKDIIDTDFGVRSAAVMDYDLKQYHAGRIVPIESCLEDLQKPTLVNSVDVDNKTFTVGMRIGGSIVATTTVDLKDMFAAAPPPVGEALVLLGWMPSDRFHTSEYVLEHTATSRDDVTPENVHRYMIPFNYHPTIPQGTELHPFCFIPHSIAPEWKGTSYWSGFIDTWATYPATVDGVVGTLAINELTMQHGVGEYYIDYPEGA